MPEAIGRIDPDGLGREPAGSRGETAGAKESQRPRCCSPDDDGVARAISRNLWTREICSLFSNEFRLCPTHACDEAPHPEVASRGLAPSDEGITIRVSGQSRLRSHEIIRKALLIRPSRELRRPPALARLKAVDPNGLPPAEGFFRVSQRIAGTPRGERVAMTVRCDLWKDQLEIQSALLWDIQRLGRAPSRCRRETSRPHANAQGA